MTKKFLLPFAFVALAAATAACGSATADDSGDVGGPAADQACLEGSADCADDPSVDVGDDPIGDQNQTCLAGSDDCADDPSVEAPPVAGMCLPDVPDCDDTAEFGDEFPTEQVRQHARGLLGANEADLADDVRIGRRGAEQMALTEDYRLGRFTVELDDTDGSGMRVVRVTVELPDGPESFDLQPG